MRKYVIEFRNGGYYGGEHLQNSVPIGRAFLFDTKEAADKVSSQYIFAGGMVVPVRVEE